MTIDNDVQKPSDIVLRADLYTEQELRISQKYLTSHPQLCLPFSEKTVNHPLNYQML
jgi:hypothetical protein